MELKAIDRTDRGMNRLNAALSIYRERIRPDEQNPERQILYWIDHSKDDLSDEFRCFSIHRRDTVVGYFQYSYFKEEHVFFFEYLCISDDDRSGLVPSDAVKCVEDLLAQNYQPNFTIVFEVAHKRTASQQWGPDNKRLAYFKRLGFRKVTFDYQFPILQSYEGELSYPADLMVRLPNMRKQLSSSELRTILRCIFFKHYLRWDRPFLEQDRFEERERLISALYSKQVARIGNDTSFGTTGDDKRSLIDRFANRQPRIAALIAKIFGPKLPRLLAVILVLLVVEKSLETGWLLMPFVFAVVVVYCLAEDTVTSTKLFSVVMSRISFGRLRQS